MYIIVLAYFLAGFMLLYHINRNKGPVEAKKSWIKTITYFFIINIVFFTITINPFFFRILTVIIIVAGFLELHKLFRESGYQMKVLFWLSIAVFSLCSVNFFIFSGMEMKTILFTFMIISIFDSFSQITGQLTGKHKILPEISPGKTLEGFIGGAVVALVSSILLRELTDASPMNAVIKASGIVAFAFVGDLSKSYYKRKYRVKDFSRLIPGHGGFLDRFDSLIAAGAWVAFTGYF